jgi:hypothetical protein
LAGSKRNEMIVHSTGLRYFDKRILEVPCPIVIAVIGRNVAFFVLYLP